MSVTADPMRASAPDSSARSNRPKVTACGSAWPASRSHAAIAIPPGSIEGKRSPRVLGSRSSVTIPSRFSRSTATRTSSASSGGCRNSMPVRRNPAVRPVCSSNDDIIAMLSRATDARNAFV
jgi:hypothetical protein